MNEILFPPFEIRTVEDLMRWHDELLEIALRVEFERKMTKSTLKTISRLKKDAMQEKESIEAAKLELKILTELQKDYRKDLASSKKLLQIIYFTNEIITTSFLEKDKIEELKKDELSRHKTPLLHGRGWRFEYQAMNFLRRKGYASFLTYGGLLDPHKVDIIAFRPEKVKVKVNLKGLEKVNLEDIF